MKQFLAVLIAVGAILCAVPAQAVVLSPGDILVGDNGLFAILRVDPVSGDRTIVSGCPTPAIIQYPFTVGSGPDIAPITGIAIAPDGSIMVSMGINGVARVDPATGNREIVADAVTGGGDVNLLLPDSVAVVPPVTTSAVSVLPSWGLALLVGISIGAWLQLRRMKGSAA